VLTGCRFKPVDPVRLLHVDFRINFVVKKGGHDIQVIDFPLISCNKAEKVPWGARGAYRCIGFIKIDAFHLLISFNNQPGFVSDGAILDCAWFCTPICNQ